MSKSRHNASFHDAPPARRLQELRDLRRLTIQALAARAELSAREISALLAGEHKKVTHATIDRLKTAFKVSTDVLMGHAALPGTSGERDVHRVATDGATRQDLKTVISDKAVSRNLLQGRIASLAACIRAAETFTPADDAHKDHPFVPTLAYNHFLQVSAIISVNDAKRRSRHVLAYERKPRPGLPAYKHTPGRSILWAASFTCRLSPGPWGPIDRWMSELHTHPDTAREEFTMATGSVLTDVLSYKIDLRDVPLQISPFAVITNDQRTEPRLAGKTQRVYTQFTFRVQLSRDALERSKQPDVAQRSYGAACSYLPEQPMDDEILNALFTDDKSSKLNVMDVLAWRGMFSSDNGLVLDKASLTQGFDVT